MDCWYIQRPSRARSALTGGGFMPDDTPVLDTLVDITAASLAHNSLPPRELMIARLAALIAVDAPPASYPGNAEAAADSGVTAGDVPGGDDRGCPGRGYGAGGFGRRGRSSERWKSRSPWPTRWPTTSSSSNHRLLSGAGRDFGRSAVEGGPHDVGDQLGRDSPGKNRYCSPPSTAAVPAVVRQQLMSSWPRCQQITSVGGSRTPTGCTSRSPCSRRSGSLGI